MSAGTADIVDLVRLSKEQLLRVRNVFTRNPIFEKIKKNVRSLYGSFVSE